VCHPTRRSVGGARPDAIRSDNLSLCSLSVLPELSPPIRICGGLSRNVPAELDTLFANCSARSRRKFTDVASGSER
jgi:hypothetical protein